VVCGEELRSLLTDKKNMTDNKIVELTPFRADLTRSLSRRGERILAAVATGQDTSSFQQPENQQ
jgi:hypothetical protein